MPAKQIIKPFERFPIVMCPGCRSPMTLKETRPLLATSELVTARYHCDQCGTDSKREFKRQGADL